MRLVRHKSNSNQVLSRGILRVMKVRNLKIPKWVISPSLVMSRVSKVILYVAVSLSDIHQRFPCSYRFPSLQCIGF